MLNLLNRNVLTLQPSGIRRFTNLAHQTPGCTMLTIGEPDFDTPAPIRAAACAALDAGMTHYPPNTGSPALRQAVSDFEARTAGLHYGPEEIIMTSGATEAIYLAMQGVLNPGDEVIVPLPAFSLYESIARLCGAKLVYLDTAADGFQITRENLAAHMSRRTKLLVLNSPNNPTGCIYTDETLENIRRAVAGKPMFVLCDDVYSRLTYAPCPQLSQCPDLRSQLLVVQSFSKPWAMTGWRLGYLMCDAPIAQRLALLHAAVVVSVASYAQPACIEALQTDVSELLHTYRARRDYVCARLEAMGLPFSRPEGAFYVFPSIARYGLSSEEFCTRMIQQGKLAAVPGTCFGTEGHIRLSYCYSQPQLEQGMDKLEAFLKTLE